MKVNFHMVVRFRSRQGEALTGLLTEQVASPMAVGVVKRKAAEHDGMRVRSSAGAA